MQNNRSHKTFDEQEGTVSSKGVKRVGCERRDRSMIDHHHLTVSHPSLVVNESAPPENPRRQSYRSIHHNRIAKASTNKRDKIIMGLSSNYGAVATAEPVDESPVATVVEGSPAVVRVIAPSNLPEGYEYLVHAVGHRMVATVPKGGVRKGQEFQATVIPVGGWRDGLFDCFSFGLCHPQCCLTFWCTPLALGQLMTRMNLNFIGSPHSTTNGNSTTPSTISPFTLMLILVIVYVVVDCIVALMIEPYLNAEEEDEETGQIYTADELYMPPWVLRLRAFGQAWEFFYGFFVFVVLFRVRNHVRKRYSIPSSTYGCGDGLEDCCCAMLCGPCSVCQMMRHTSDYRHDEAACCTPTGLRMPPETV
eukprot:scaffold4976_cov161-Amphora_coffeaeformis.AAC.22